MYLELPKHAGVAQSILLDPCQIKKLGNTLVVGTDHFGVNLGLDRALGDWFKSRLGKKVHLKRQTENSLEADVLGPFQQALKNCFSNALALVRFVYGEGSYLAQVLPHHVQSPATHNLAGGVLGDQKLLDRFVELNSLFAQQYARLNQRTAEIGDDADVRGLSWPNLD